MNKFELTHSPKKFRITEVDPWIDYISTPFINLVTEGHSQMSAISWQLRSNNRIRGYNDPSTSGATIADIELRAATIDSYLVAETDTLKNILALWIGVNDVVNTAGQGLIAYNATKSYVQDRLAAGWTIYVYTMIRSTFARGAQFEIERNIFNGLLKSDLENLLKVHIIDCDIRTEFSDSTDLDYIYDLLHLTGRGSAIAVELFGAKYRRINHSFAPVETLGNDIIDSTWCDAINTYWDNYFQANWSGDGTKLISNGNNGVASMTYLVVGKRYKVTVTATVTSGYVYFGITPATLYKSGTLTFYFVATSNVFPISSLLFNGTITALSIEYATNEQVSLTDADSNVYTEVTIGTQTWLVENLKTTKFNDGSNITNETDNATWAALTTAAYCWYNNNIANKVPYGALYNFHVLKNIYGVAPEGYHPASKRDYTILIAALGGVAVAGGHMKENGTDHWTVDNADNTSGFTQVGSGYRNMGAFAQQKGYCIEWEATERAVNTAYRNYLAAADTTITQDFEVETEGYIIRCIKD